MFAVSDREILGFLELLLLSILSLVVESKICGNFLVNRPSVNRFPKLKVGSLFGRLACVVVGKILKLYLGFPVLSNYLISESFPNRLEASLGFRKGISESVVDRNVVYKLLSDERTSRAGKRLFSDILQGLTAFVDKFNLSSRFQVGISRIFELCFEGDWKLRKSVRFGEFFVRIGFSNLESG